MTAADTQPEPAGWKPEDGEDDSLRAVVVDDHPVVRAGIRLLLEELGAHVVDEAGRLADGVLATRRRVPDLLVLDADLPDGDGVAAIERLRSEAPSCKVVVLAADPALHRVREAFGNGADGYVLKSAAQTGVIAALRAVVRGGRAVDPTLAVHLLQTELAAASHPLSAREREVLRLLARGHTNRELARMLFISPRTAESHRRNIMRKLRLTSRVEMVAYALRAGMLDPEPAPA